MPRLTCPPAPPSCPTTASSFAGLLKTASLCVLGLTVLMVSLNFKSQPDHTRRLVIAYSREDQLQPFYWDVNSDHRGSAADAAALYRPLGGAKGGAGLKHGTKKKRGGKKKHTKAESFVEEEQHEYFKRHGLLSFSGQGTVLDSFDQAFANMFPVSDSTVEAIRGIRELHATYPPDLPRACVVLLLYPIHCGEACVAPMSKDRSCTQERAAKRMLRNLRDGFLKSHNYPVVMLHQDLREEDMAALREHYPSGRLFFQRVVFDEDTVPAYTDTDAFLPWIRSKHPNGDVSVPNPHFHGFGYRMMCRLFSGLLFHAPLLREFDYYLRVDAGDSWVGPLSHDPFAKMVAMNASYVYIKDGTNYLPFLGPTVYSFLTQHKADITPDQQLFCEVMDCEHEQYKDHYFYNNFEMVHMTPYRSKAHWDFFMHVDRSNLFLCNYDAVNKRCWTEQDVESSGGGVGGAVGSGTMTLAEYRARKAARRDPVKMQGFEGKAIGDGDFRTVATALLLRKAQVVQMPGLPYSHPNADWCQD